MRKLFTSLLLATFGFMLSTSVQAQGAPDLAGKTIIRQGTALTSENDIREDQWYIIVTGDNLTVCSPTGARLVQNVTGVVVGQPADNDAHKQRLVRFVADGQASTPQVVGTTTYPAGQTHKKWKIINGNGMYFQKLVSDNTTIAGGTVTSDESNAASVSFLGGAAFTIYDHIGGGALNRAGQHPHGWIKDGVPTGFYRGFKLIPVVVGTPVSVTVQYKYKGVVVKNEQVVFSQEYSYASQGFQLPTFYGVTPTADLTAVPSATNNTLTITYTDNANEPFPFNFYSTYNEAGQDFYTLQVKGLYAKYDATKATANAAFLLGQDAQLGDDYKFQFVGDPINGFKFYNKAVGSGKALRMNNLTVDNATLNVLDAATEVAFHLQKFNNNWFFRVASTSDNWLNYRNPYLSTWKTAVNNVKNDAGSMVLFKNADAELFYTGQLNTHRDAKKASLNVPSLFAADAIAAAQATITAAAPATVDTQEELTQAIEAVNTAYDQALNTLYGTLNGKQLKLKNRYRDQGALYMNPALNGELFLENEATMNAAERVFVLEKLEGDKVFALQSAVTKKYVQIVKTTDTRISVKSEPKQGFKLHLVADAGNAYVAFEAISNQHATYPALHGDAGKKVVIWETNSVASHWIVESADDVTAEQILTAAQARLTRAKQAADAAITVGTELGQCTVQPTAAQTAATSSQDIAVIDNAVLDYVAGEGYALNLPTDGMLLRMSPQFHSEARAVSLSGAPFNGNLHGGGTATNYASLVPTANAANDPNTVFYYKDGKLISVGAGRALVLREGSVLSMGDYDTAGTAATFAAANGKYNISFGNKYLAADANLQYAEGLDALGAKTEFALSAVTSIPVVVNETGHATFYTPVAVTVQSGYTAYKAKASTTPGYLTLEELTGVIPAGTAFVIKGAQGVCQLTLSNEAGTAVTNNALTGNHEGQAPAANTYALVKNSANEAVFAKLGDAVNRRGFRAFYVAANAGTQEYLLNFGSVVTGVQMLDVQPLTAPLYDLSGRRVLAPVKGGLYLQGGRKVIAE